MSDTNRVNLIYEQEDVFGIADTGAGIYKELRFTGESLHQESAVVESQEIRSDRQIVDVIRTTISGAGDINFELSYGAYDDFFEAALFSTVWTTPDTVGPITTISSAAGTGDYTLSDSGSGFTALNLHQWVKVSGFAGANAPNNGIGKLTARTDAAITIAGNGDGFTASAGDSVTVVQGAQLLAGKEDLRSFAIEKEYEDTAAAEFALLTGMSIDNFNLDIAADAVITGAFSFMGSKEVSNIASQDTGTPIVAPTNEVMSAVDSVQTVVENLAALDVTAVSFSLANNLRTRLVVGKLGADSIGVGSIGVTGTLVKYFTSKALMDKFLNFTSTSLGVVVEDSTGKGYVFDFPEIKFSSAQRVATGKDQDVMAELEWQAFKDPVLTEAQTFRMVRFAA